MMLGRVIRIKKTIGSEVILSEFRLTLHCSIILQMIERLRIGRKTAPSKASTDKLTD